MFGICAYPGMDVSIDDTIKYIENSKKYNVNYAMTSMHTKFIDEKRKFNEFIKILECCRKNDIEVVVDISKGYFDTIDWTKYPVVLRLDFGFDDQEIVDISNKYKIQLNASTVTKEWFDRLIKLGLNTNGITVCHNFYPRINTGLSSDLLLEKNKLFHNLGLKIIAFMPSSYSLRGYVYSGLPTLEEHRYLHPIIAMQDLINYYGTDIVLIGDHMASEEELISLSKIKKDIITLPIIAPIIAVKNFKKYFVAIHTNRGDINDYALRSTTMRCSASICPYNTVNRPIGAITIDNNLYKAYYGELQITKQNLPADNRVNVIGYVMDNNVLIKKIKPEEKFNFYFL